MNLNLSPEELEIKITVSDASAYGGCVRGWKLFCDSNGINWKLAVRQGISAKQLLATNDAIAEDIVRYKLTGEKLL